jgi:hypothetical protein
MLIGCERRERKARLMEIDPKYADCIVRRFQEYTGEQAVLDEIDSMKEQIGSGHPEVIPKACSSGGPEVLLYRPILQ